MFWLSIALMYVTRLTLVINTEASRQLGGSPRNACLVPKFWHDKPLFVYISPETCFFSFSSPPIFLARSWTQLWETRLAFLFVCDKENRFYETEIWCLPEFRIHVPQWKYHHWVRLVLLVQTSWFPASYLSWPITAPSQRFSCKQTLWGKICFLLCMIASWPVLLSKGAQQKHKRWKQQRVPSEQGRKGTSIEIRGKLKSFGDFCHVFVWIGWVFKTLIHSFVARLVKYGTQFDKKWNSCWSDVQKQKPVRVIQKGTELWFSWAGLWVLDTSEQTAFVTIVTAQNTNNFTDQLLTSTHSQFEASSCQNKWRVPSPLLHIYLLNQG